MPAGGPVDYGAIGEDVAFFLSVSTETDAQYRALAPRLYRLGRGGRRLSILDFGGGSGAFLAGLLERSGLPAAEVCLVEPVAAARAAAAARLAAPGRTQRASADLDGLEPAARFDVVLANHSLYYVDDPHATVGRLRSLVAPGGLLVAALLDRDNALARIWRAGYASAGLPFPFVLAGEVEDSLGRLGCDPDRDVVDYRIDFEDRPDLCLRVLRFLFGEDLDRIGRSSALALFDRHRRDGRVVIETAYRHLVASSADGSPSDDPRGPTRP